ncbi:Scr1 family TA system antitoxin-like transcriptional regulator [Streptomyces syringium]|uniref:Transcriptional regulator with XRE-family HTH domain n=1 Tax=Streptomyces syringium TaxID=76729 RepID=A0ABS4XW54_9ACTN|nr:Scr1 family TA system antitoxin-like transcriptional regulator [Streptomyces syringium]MBP2400746.1 transcriptional regulator with XRE-family HTH domain [Streptomyces syringium]
MSSPPPAAAALVVGVYLRYLRCRAGKVQQDAADATGCSVATISRMERAEALPPEGDLGTLLRLYNRYSAWELEGLKHLLAQARPRQACHRAGDVAPGWRVRLFGVEREAISMRVYSSLMVPGMFQAPAYAQALVRRHGGLIVDPDLSAVTARPAPRGHPSGCRVEIVLEEAALRSATWGPGVVAGQCWWLRRAADLEQVEVRFLSPEQGLSVPPGNLAELTLPGGQLLFVQESLAVDDSNSGDSSLHTVLDGLWAQAGSAEEGLAVLREIEDRCGEEE